ncbi:MAG: DDE-type integrase/transposase/recombinase [Pseudonocardiaceae bacterium]
MPQVRANLRERTSPPAVTPRDKWHLDEVFIKINGKTHYLWRAVNQDGSVLDILVTSRRDAKAATKVPQLSLPWPAVSRSVVSTALENWIWIWPTFRDRVGFCLSRGEQDAFAE